jgi:hypothetical protein
LVFEKIVASYETTQNCPKCIPCILIQSGLTGKRVYVPKLADRQISAPGGLRCNGKDGGMVLSEQQMKKIKEPVWQDEKTGAVTAVH